MGSETSNFGEKARGSKLLPALCVHGAGGAAKCSLQGLLTTLVIISTTQTPALRPPAASASQAFLGPCGVGGQPCCCVLLACLTQSNETSAFPPLSQLPFIIYQQKCCWHLSFVAISSVLFVTVPIFLSVLVVTRDDGVGSICHVSTESPPYTFLLEEFMPLMLQLCLEKCKSF